MTHRRASFGPRADTVVGPRLHCHHGPNRPIQAANNGSLDLRPASARQVPRIAGTDAPASTESTTDPALRSPGLLRFGVNRLTDRDHVRQELLFQINKSTGTPAESPPHSLKMGPPTPHHGQTRRAAGTSTRPPCAKLRSALPWRACAFYQFSFFSQFGWAMTKNSILPRKKGVKVGA